MDSRFTVYGMDSKRDDIQIILHPEATISEVRDGTAADDIDLSQFVSAASHTLSQAEVTLNWNYELFGVHQPAPNQIFEVRAQNIPLWIGIVDSINSYTISRGERQLQMIARSRDSFDIWKTSKRVTDVFPVLTEFSMIARQIGETVGLTEDEILLPLTSFHTRIPSMQLSDMSAWEMLSTLLLPVGLAPFIDGIGRLRAANRQLNGRVPDLVLDDFVKVQASRTITPSTRVILHWLDPVLGKVVQQNQKLADRQITTGQFTDVIDLNVTFSGDGSQRAQDTYMVVRHSANHFLGVVVNESESFKQTSDTTGNIHLVSRTWVATMALLIVTLIVLSAIPDGVIAVGFIFHGGITLPIGRVIEATASVWILQLLSGSGIGQYDIWGCPFSYVNVRNTSVAYDSNAPTWVDNPVTIESDFVLNEVHAHHFAARELIYQAKAANKFHVQTLENLNFEYGDLVQFPDGSTMFVEDIQRNLMRGSDNTLQLTGFISESPKAV